MEYPPPVAVFLNHFLSDRVNIMLFYSDFGAWKSQYSLKLNVPPLFHLDLQKIPPRRRDLKPCVLVDMELD